MCQHLQCIHLSSLCVFAGKQLSAPLAHFCRTRSRSLAGAVTFLPVWLADAAPDISRPGACNPFLTRGRNVVGEITWQQARPACAWGLTSRSQQSPPAAQPTHSSPKHWGQAPRDALGALCRRCLLQATCRSHQAERGWGSEAITAVGCQLQGEDKKCLPVCLFRPFRPARGGTAARTAFNYLVPL